jgi:two-component system osmolarity sensor histidine kinase EnvZ
LRNQIRPILRLTAAVDDFGKGRAVADFQPRGAREVRQATVAFHQMRRRVERQIDQRTAMLAGVSHDLRTILTRLRLQLAFIEDSADVDALKNDIDDMNRMLEGYLAFARGESDEETVPTDIALLLDELAQAARISGHATEVSFSGDPNVSVRPRSFKRCLANLVGNAGRHGRHVAVTGIHADGLLTITVDDDGPGVPFEEQEAVFKPFYRLDDARNLDETGTGLGLPIARDIARNHGGDIALSDSPMGGLRVTVTVPA